MALLWAAGIIWVAYDVASPGPQDANASANSDEATDVTGTHLTSQDANKLAEELNSF